MQTPEINFIAKTVYFELKNFKLDYAYCTLGLNYPTFGANNTHPKLQKESLDTKSEENMSPKLTYLLKTFINVFLAIKPTI